MDNLETTGRLMDIVIKAGKEMKSLRFENTTIVQVSDDWFVVCENGEPKSSFNLEILSDIIKQTKNI